MFFFDPTNNFQLGDWPTADPNSRPPNWLTVFNTSAGLASQIVSAYGRNPSTQIGVGYAGNGVFTVQGLQRSFDDFPRAQASPYANLTPAQFAALQQGGGVGLDDAAGSITSFISRNPLLVAGVAFGAFLLFREPPRRR